MAVNARGFTLRTLALLALAFLHGAVFLGAYL